MTNTKSLRVSLLAVWAVVAVTSASDRNLVYARVDKVVLEPSPEAPQRIQVWGIFAMAQPTDPNNYLPPARGYLYFVLANNPQAAQHEWADLKTVAGTGQIVSFGNRWEMKARVRNADEKPASPDAYSVSIGLTKVRGNTDYAPVRALLDARP